MPRNGSGSFSFASGYPFTTGTVISSTDVNAVLLDIANTFTASIAKDGQTTATADIPMGGFKFTSIGDASLRTQFPSVGQLQDGTLHYLTGVAGTNTITGALAPSIATTGYVTGMRITFAPAVTNTGATTLSVNSLAAKNIFVLGAACVGGELVAGRPATVVYDGTQFQLQNSQFVTGTGAYALAISPTFTGTVGAATITATGTITGNLFSGSGASLTALNATNLSSGTVPDARFPATLPALNGSALTSLTAANITAAGTLPALNGSALTALNASNLASGTVPDARFPATLPAASGINLTALNATNIASGSLADARLSANVPLLNAANTFSAAQIIVAADDADTFQIKAATSGRYIVTAWDAANNQTLIRALNTTASAYVKLKTQALTMPFVTTDTGTNADITFNGVAASDFARLSQANSFSVGSGSNVQSIDANDGTSSAAYLYFKQAATGKAQLGINGTGGSVLITGGTGSALAMSSSAGIEMSGDLGSTLHFRLDASGNYNFKAGTVTTNNASASEVGYKGIPQNSQSVDYTAVLADANKHIYETGASKTITIPANGSVAYPIGTTLTFIAAANAVTIAITTDTLRLAGTATTGSRTLAAYGIAQAVKTASTTWQISGAGLS